MRAHVYVDAHRRFRITYPERWSRAAKRLTPSLSNPREIVTVSTLKALPVGGGRCAQFPTNALAAMSRGDALVSVQEVSGDYGDGFRRKPLHASLSTGFKTEAAECVGHARFVSYVFPVRVGQRRFDVFIALGTAASPMTRAAALDVVDSFGVLGG